MSMQHRHRNVPLDNALMNRAEPSDVSRLIVFVYIMYAIRICTETVLHFTPHRRHTVQYVHKMVIDNVALMILIVDACITRNVPQMKGYMVFDALDQFRFLLDLRIPKNRYFLAVITTRITTVGVEIAVVYVFVRRFSKYYDWYCFKKIGTDKSLKDALRTRKQLVLLFKILIVLRFRNFLATRLVLLPATLFYIVNMLDILVAIVFFYFQKTENVVIRALVILFYVLSEVRLVVTLFTYMDVLFSYREM